MRHAAVSAFRNGIYAGKKCAAVAGDDSFTAAFHDTCRNVSGLSENGDGQSFRRGWIAADFSETVRRVDLDTDGGHRHNGSCGLIYALSGKLREDLKWKISF